MAHTFGVPFARSPSSSSATRVSVYIDGISTERLRAS